MDPAKSMCVCLLHEQAKTKFADLLTSHIQLDNYHELPGTYSVLLEEFCPDIPRSSGHFICRGCVQLLRTKLETQSSAKKRKVSGTPEPCEKDLPFTILLGQIENRDFSLSELQDLLRVIGKKVSPFLLRFVNSTGNVDPASRINEMLMSSSSISFTDSFEPIQSFFEGILKGMPHTDHRNLSDEAQQRRQRLMFHAMESIYAAVNSRYVSSFVLAEMLYMYFMTNSKRAVEIYANATGCASYYSLRNILSTIASRPNPIPKTGYLIVGFDNNQVLGKTYTIQLHSKFGISVVTTITAFQPEVSQNPQKEERNFPLYLALTDGGKTELLHKLSVFRTSAEACVRNFTLEFINARLEHFQQHGLFNPTESDFKDYVVQNSACPPERVGLEYHRVPTSGTRCRIFDQPCILTNPNSYKNVQKVLDHILHTCVSEQRNWIAVVADGLPYYLAQELVRRCFQCSLCPETFLDSELKHHYLEIHQQSVPSNLERKYRKIFIRPGAGHYEMNLVKAIYREWFPIFIEPVADLMGFRSPRAKSVCASALDHHKSYQLLEIVFEALADELVYCYLRHCQFETKTTPSAHGFVTEMSNTNNSYMQGAFHFLFDVCFPLFLFRSGVRQCNFNVSIQAREVASSVFYAFHHPKYQRINCYDMAELMQMPSDIRATACIESLRIPNSEFGQGIDFLLEQRNKKLKSFVIHSGVPTHEQWLQASNSLPTLEQVVENCGRRLGLKLESHQHKEHNFTEEKRATRYYFRSTNYFDLKAANELRTTNDSPVSKEFVEYKTTAEMNRAEFYQQFISTGKGKVQSYIDVITKPADISEMTNDRLRQQIKLKCCSLPEDMRQQFLHKLGTEKKSVLIDRLNMLAQLVEDLHFETDEIM